MKLIGVLFFALLLWFWPWQPAIDPRGWHLFSLFAATIVGIMLRPMPMGAVAVIGMTAAVITGTLPLQTLLNGFANEQIWLIVIACWMARGFIKTGLGNRIAYLFLSAFGSHPLGLAYGFVLSDLILAPAIPSSTARAGGVMMPILKSVVESLGEHHSPRKIAGFLTMSVLHGSMITGAMFLTAMSANPVAAKLAAESGYPISWALWAKAAVVPGLLSLALMPLILYLIYPPQLKHTAPAQVVAKMKLKEMGRVTRDEWSMLAVFALVLSLWIFGKEFGIAATTAAMVGLVALLVLHVLSWKDILNEEVAWDTLIWFTALVTMAAQLNDLGFIPWLSAKIVYAVAGFSWPYAVLFLALIYFYSHYLFASITAHVSAMFQSLLLVGLAAGAPPMLFVLLLSQLGSLFGGLTHYSSGQAPLLFSLRYVGLRQWWAIGAFLSLIYALIWSLSGILWWRFLGLW